MVTVSSKTCVQILLVIEFVPRRNEVNICRRKGPSSHLRIMAEAIPMNAANVNQIPNATYGADLGPNESFKMPDGQDSDNADRRSSDEAATIEEATVRVKADVRALQQLSSSGRAAQRKRDINQAKKGFRAVGEAVDKYFGKEGEEGGGHDI
ncbi:hypothetical protein RJZ56_005332 [Blastomyces dermatitidis]